MVSVAATASSDEDLSSKRRRAIGARLRTEDWNEMARPAFESPNHVSSLDRWIALAKAENPHLDDSQAARQAQRLKSEYYAELSAAGVRARRAQAAIDRVEGRSGDGE